MDTNTSSATQRAADFLAKNALFLESSYNGRPRIGKVAFSPNSNSIDRAQPGTRELLLNHKAAYDTFFDGVSVGEHIIAKGIDGRPVTLYHVKSLNDLSYILRQEGVYIPGPESEPEPEDFDNASHNDDPTF